MACTLKMIARLMPAPTRQYSIEVVPDWSDRNLAIRWLTRPSCLKVADLRAGTTRKLGPIGYKEVDQQSKKRVKSDIKKSPPSGLFDGGFARFITTRSMLPLLDLKAPVRCKFPAVLLPRVAYSTPHSPLLLSHVH